MLAQRCVDHRPDAIRIAKHLIVPEAKNAVTLSLDHACPRKISNRIVLTAVDFDNELCAVTGKIGDEMANRDLPTEMLFRPTVAQHSPKRALGVCHSFA